MVFIIHITNSSFLYFYSFYTDIFFHLLQVSYLIVDDMHSEHPELIKDAYWDSMDFVLPYTAATEQYKMDPYLGSTNEIEYVSLNNHCITVHNR